MRLYLIRVYFKISEPFPISRSVFNAGDLYAIYLNLMKGKVRQKKEKDTFWARFCHRIGPMRAIFLEQNLLVLWDSRSLQRDLRDSVPDWFLLTQPSLYQVCQADLWIDSHETDCSLTSIPVCCVQHLPCYYSVFCANKSQLFQFKIPGQLISGHRF